MKPVGILRFPGSNCDYDVLNFVNAKELKGEFISCRDQFEIAKYSHLILPGGFSFGDYLRAGALAARTPAMKSVREFALKGGPVLGICNGFQILTEAQLLPGALMKNESLRFQDEWVEMRLESKHSEFGPKNISLKSSLRLPIAHGEGRYYDTEDQLKKLEDHGQVWLRYLKNPNGSHRDIAGIFNEMKNVAALMPHPERALFDWMGGTDGGGFL
jgi:phosphoribosylformylglycinamidine synthase